MGRPRAYQRLDKAAIASAMRQARDCEHAGRLLGVNGSTVRRWVTCGRVPRPGSGGPLAVAPRTTEPRVLPTDAAAWAAGIRAGFALEETEAVTLRLAEEMLALALDAARSVSERTSAAKTWQGLVRQLDLQEADDGEAVQTAYPRRA